MGNGRRGMLEISRLSLSKTERRVRRCLVVEFTGPSIAYCSQYTAFGDLLEMFRNTILQLLYITRRLSGSISGQPFGADDFVGLITIYESFPNNSYISHRPRTLLCNDRSTMPLSPSSVGTCPLIHPNYIWCWPNSGDVLYSSEGNCGYGLVHNSVTCLEIESTTNLPLTTVTRMGYLYCCTNALPAHSHENTPKPEYEFAMDLMRSLREVSIVYTYTRLLARLHSELVS